MTQPLSLLCLVSESWENCHYTVPKWFNLTIFYCWIQPIHLKVRNNSLKFVEWICSHECRFETCGKSSPTKRIDNKIINREKKYAQRVVIYDNFLLYLANSKALNRSIISKNRTSENTLICWHLLFTLSLLRSNVIMRCALNGWIYAL